MVMHPLVLGAANAVLGPYCERIQLNLTQLITILPGQTAQPLHRDRFVWGGRGTGFEGAGGLPRRIEPQFNAIWALTDFTSENGATTVAPGSPLRGSRSAERATTTPLELGSELTHRMTTRPRLVSSTFDDAAGR